MKSSEPFFSVIINVYNGAELLRETVDSLLAQSFENWELIFWDDQSQDDSFNICRLLVESIGGKARLYQSNPKTTLAEARLAASRRANGMWVIYLDQDDLWSPTMLWDMHKKIIEGEAVAKLDNIGLAYSRTQRIFENGTTEDFDLTHANKSLPEGDIFDAQILRPGFIATSAYAFKRVALATIDKVPAGVSLCPDYLFGLVLSIRWQAVAVQKANCFYRVHSGNMSHKIQTRVYREICEIVSLALIERKSLHAKWCLRRHNSLIACSLLRCAKTFHLGLLLLIREGSFAYLLARPLVRSIRRASLWIR